MSYPAARGSSPRAGRSSYAPGYSYHTEPGAPAPWPPGASRPEASTSTRRVASGSSHKAVSTSASPMAGNTSGMFEDADRDMGGNVGYNNGHLNGGGGPYPSAGPSSSGVSHQYHTSPYTSDLPAPSSLEFPQAMVGNTELFPSSQSSNSLSSNLRGRRAPAPAALDLRSPERVPLAPTAEPTGPQMDNWDAYVQEQHSLYKLAKPVQQERPVLSLDTDQPHPQLQQQQPLSARRIEAVPFPTQMSPQQLSSRYIPVSAYGMTTANEDPNRISVFDPRASIASSDRAGQNGDRVSIDSYYLGAGPGNEGLSPGDRHSALTPSTPDYFDPSNIDRRGLVGVGELATPRWGASDSRHLRTPSMPHDFSLTPPVPPLDRTMFVGSAPGRQSAWIKQSEAGAAIGLGVKVMERVEESPRRDRLRHRSVSHDSPARQANLSSSSSQHGLSALDSLLSLSSLGDFSFDSTIEPTNFASTLNMPEHRMTSPPTRTREMNRASAPPAPKSYTSSFTVPAAAPPVPPPRVLDSPLSAPPESAPEFPGSGSARERIYARRASRQQAAAVAAGIPPPQMIELPPLPVPKMSPPNSADSQTFRDSRKTPPYGARDTREKERLEREAALASKRRTPASPSHDILRHIAPKDFSHLPPSPSSASINQFLRGSSSGNNLANLPRTARTPPASVSSHATKPSTSSVGMTRSDSTRSRSRSQSMKVGEAAATAEALRKLDGLAPAASKRMTMTAQPTGGTPKPRPSTPTESTKRLTAKSSITSIHTAGRGKDSPLGSNWFEISHSDLTAASDGNISNAPTPSSRSNRPSREISIHATEPPPLTFEQKARESSPSLVGTPTSRDSHTQRPLSNTPPSMTRDYRAEKAARRPSVQSDISSPDGITDERSIGGDGYVPPVPPLPRGYMSMRQGLGATGSHVSMPPSQMHSPGSHLSMPQPSKYVPIHGEDELRVPPAHPATAFPSATLKSSPDMPSGISMPVVETPRTRTMSKKWSFSSALSLNKLHKEKESTLSPSLSPAHPLASPNTFSSSVVMSPSAMMSPRSHTSHITDYADSPSTPATPWSERGVDLTSPRVPPKDTSHSSDSVDFDSRSHNSATPIAPSTAGLAPPVSKNGSKRLTPSSIPFFRRASSSSVSLANKLHSPIEQQPATPRFSVQAPPTSTTATGSSSTATAAQRTPSGTRKSMLGMHIPAMLRGSGSKRGLSQQLSPSVVESQMAQLKLEAAARPPPPAASTAGAGVNKSTSIGRAGGRARGMTVSSGGDQGIVTSLSRKPSTSTHYSSKSDANGRLTKVASGTSVQHQQHQHQQQQQQHTLHGASSQASLRKSDNRAPPSATPTKIPRMASRPSVVTPNAQTAHSQAAHQSMLPPALPPTSMTASYSANALSSVAAGGGNGSTTYEAATDITRREFTHTTPSVRQSLQPGSTSAAHRAHLLAPMSTRKHSMSGIPAPPPATAQSSTTKREGSTGTGFTGIPSSSSRRNLPQLPSSATAMTISASAKARPAATSVRNSPSTDETVTANTAPMKSSKSFHNKATPTHSRLSLSTSVGGGGGGTSNSRRTSLAADSVSESPADDEETLADSEMGAYVTRRKSRAASASGSKKDDLSDLIGFPEDIRPAEALSQRHFISRHLGSLSDYERKEVLDFDYIYYVAHNVRRGPQPDGKMYNHGYDDERGDYIVVEGDHLCYRYEVVGILGKGSFGQVVHCRDHKSGSSVAVKIIRNKKRFHAQALVEVKILQQIVEWDPQDKHFMVKMTDHFYFRGHLCIVTELLSINLYELIKANQFCGFSTVLIRRFTTQMLASLTLMRSHRIVHCDLKPENILLRHPAKSGIKVIDFGSSCHESEKVYTYIQSRFYRSPEVILGMNYAMAIDMWSLGCILAELYTGYPIFPGENEHEQLACIMEVLGVPDNYIVQKASRRKLFFDATGAPRPFVNAKGKRRRPGTKTLSSVLKCNDELFIDFITKCLTWDPDKRLKPQPAMRHPWILAGRRRQAPPPPERDGRSSFLGGSGSSTRRSLANGSGTSDNKKGLIISPPTPLVARVPQAAPSSSRIGVSVSSARLHARNSTYVPNAQKVSLA